MGDFLSNPPERILPVPERSWIVPARQFIAGTCTCTVAATRPAGPAPVGGMPPAFNRVTLIVIGTMLPSPSCS
jgi:hypothetical protein